MNLKSIYWRCQDLRTASCFTVVIVGRRAGGRVSTSGIFRPTAANLCYVRCPASTFNSAVWAVDCLVQAFA